MLSGQLSIGDNTWVGHDVLVVGGGADVIIGKDCDIGPRVTFVTGSHRISVSGVKVAGEEFSEPIEIGDGTWVGASVTILGGVTVGESSVVGAGSLVANDVPSNVVAAATPDRVIKEI
jgi:maltose O-acetyltransferase